LRFIDGLAADGRMDSRETIGNDISLSNGLDKEEFIISFNGILFRFKLGD
jgi:hypothetical protein